MPLCRIRQVTEAISQRLIMHMRANAAMVEWHAKHVASVSAMDEKAGKEISNWKLMPDEDDERRGSPRAAEMSREELEVVTVGGAGSPTAIDDPRNDLAIDWLMATLQPMREPKS
jgi:hypothetical protein